MSDHFDLIYSELFDNLPSKTKTQVEAKNKPKHEEEKPEQKLTEKNKRKLKTLRKAGNEEWQDSTLADWPEGDFRIYCCNLGNEVNEAILGSAF